jgi:hypothetical protein
MTFSYQMDEMQSFIMKKLDQIPSDDLSSRASNCDISPKGRYPKNCCHIVLW